MSDHNPDREYPQACTEFDEPRVYQFRIEGHLGSHWKSWFGQVDIYLDNNGYSLLTVAVNDQAALHGVLKKIRNAGMTLESVVRITCA